MTENMDHTKSIYFYVPEDKDLQAALGVLVIRHGHLEYALRMTIRSLCGLSIRDALIDTNKQGAKKLRERIEKEARVRLGQCEALEKLLNFLTRSWKASDKRNSFVHNIWAYELDGPLLIQGDDFNWQPIPTIQELNDLSNEIKRITDELNRDRTEGTIFEELKKLK